MNQIASLFRRSGLLLLIGLSLILTSFISSSNFDQRLIDVYGIDYLSKLDKNQPGLIDFLTFKLDHSYEVVDMTGKSSEISYSLLSNVEFNNKSNNKSVSKNALDQYRSGSLNVLQFKFNLDQSNRTYYQIDGSNDFIMFYSEHEVKKMYKNQK